MSPSINELALALSKAQGVMEAAKKDQNNPYFKSKYADLASIWAACKKPLSDNGLAVVQLTSSRDNEIGIITILTHSSGQYIKSEIFIKPLKTDPQSIGSCLTYLRRYSLAAIVGMSQEDDDANLASKVNDQQFINDSQIKEIAALINQTNTDLDRFLTAYKLDSLESMSLSIFNNAKSILEGKKQKGVNNGNTVN